jgi:hypothetical protein
MGFVFIISSLVILYRDDYMFGDLNIIRFILLVFMFVVSIIFLIISPSPWAQFGHEIVQCSTDLGHLYRIYSNPTHDKHQWLLLQFIVLLMMDTKGVRNM